MTFASPGWLWSLLLVPLLVAGYVVAQDRRRRYAVRFTNLDLLANLATASPRWRRHVPPVLAALAFVTLLVGLARPEIEMRVPREEASVILTLDDSGSMRATDVEPTRLAAARQAARRFIDGLPDEVRVGVVSFSNGAQILSPPVADRDAAFGALEMLDGRGGTAMGDGLARALDLARGVIGDADVPAPTDSPPVVIVLLSDGSNTTGATDPLAAAREAAIIGVPVFTIALGTDDGIAEVPLPDGSTRIVPVPPDRPTLRRIAETSSGRAFDAPSEADLDAIYDDLGSRVGYSTQRREATAIVAGIAAALLLAGAALSMAWFGRLP